MVVFLMTELNFFQLIHKIQILYKIIKIISYIEIYTNLKKKTKKGKKIFQNFCLQLFKSRFLADKIVVGGKKASLYFILQKQSQKPYQKQGFCQ